MNPKPDRLTVWECLHTGRAMQVSGDSSEEFDAEECSCGSSYRKFDVVRLTDFERVDQQRDELLEAIDRHPELTPYDSALHRLAARLRQVPA